MASYLNQPRFRKSLTDSLCHTEVWRLFLFSNSIRSSFELLREVRDDVISTAAKMDTEQEGFYSTKVMEPIWESFALAMTFTLVQYMRKDECVVRPPAQRHFLCSQVHYLKRGISSRIWSTTMKHIDILGNFEAQRAFFGSFPQPRGIKEDKMRKRS